MSQTNQLQLSPEEIRALPDEQKRALLMRVRELKRRVVAEGPKTKQELKAWIKDEIGIEVTDKAVCVEKGHCSPLDFLWEIYSGETHSALLVANRGGGKTFFVALHHYLRAKFWPPYWGLSFAASGEQANRAYDHLLNWIHELREVDGGKQKVLKLEIESSLKGGTHGGGKTRWETGSRVEAVTGSEKAVSGPHPNTAHGDEVEQQDDDTFEQSRNMAVAGMTLDGRRIPAQDLLTSTRQSARGRVQKLMDDIKGAVSRGFKPPHKLFMWCFVETSENQPNCRVAPENEGRPDDELCDCHLVLGPGKNEEGEDRTFDKTCGGRLYHSDGWRPIEEVHNTFQQNAPSTWQAQQECDKPSQEGNYIRWNEHRFEIFDYDPDPENGPIYMGVDWGGTAPHSVHWYQRLDYETYAKNAVGDRIVMPQDSLVCFDEVYVAEISTEKLAERVLLKESDWRKKHSTFTVKARFADPQGKADRMQFKDKGLRCTWPYGSRRKEGMIADVQTLVNDDEAMFACTDRCPMWVSEVVVWKKHPRTEAEVMEFNHAMSDWRYAVVNIHKLEGKERKKGLVRKVGDKADKISKRRSARNRRFGQIGSRVRADHPSDQFSPR